MRRLRHAACMLADIGWRTPPDYRGDRSYNIISQATFVGVDHPGRVFLALTVYFRYEGATAKAGEDLVKLLDEGVLERARQLAATVRLGYVLSAAMPGMLAADTPQREPSQDTYTSSAEKTERPAWRGRRQATATTG